MKRSDHETKRKGTLIRRCLAMMTAITSFVSLALPDYGVLPRAGAADEETLQTLAESKGNNELLAHFEFDESGNRLADTSGNNAAAKLSGPDATYIVGTEETAPGITNSYLDLTDPNAYLSLPGNILTGLTEMTVEMRVQTKDTGTNWAFYAAPDENSQVWGQEKYLGILLDNNGVKVERFANGRDNANDFYFYGNYTADDIWHEIRVEFKQNYTDVYIDNSNSPISHISSKSLADCLGANGAIWFGHAAWGSGEGFNGYIDDIVISGKTADGTEKTVVSLDFEGGNILTDNNSGITATSVDGTVTKYEQYDFFGSAGGKTYLDLDNKRAYLSLTKADGSGLLKDMAEVTVEMRINTVTQSGTQWLFYAAPDDKKPAVGTDKYLGVYLATGNDPYTAFARRYDGARPAVDHAGNSKAGLASAGMDMNDWYTLIVSFEAGKTTISIQKDTDAEPTVLSTTDLSANIWDCVEENSVLWLGYSCWREEQFFNGYIDDIKIWGTPRDKINETAENVENSHIVTKNVVDPANTTVNMFDYWTFGGQNGRDYGWEGYKPENELLEDLINNGINKDHLFLFDGSASIGGIGNQRILGGWNQYGGIGLNNTESDTFESKWGIVKNTLPENGYPQLSLDKGWSAPTNATLKELWDTKGKTTESLAYLFDPKEKVQKGKVSYPNVTGLFRVNDKGYYYFRSQDVFAELNAEQPYAPNTPKKSTENNHITLYDTPWREAYARGQFFPFNDWTQLFYEANGNIGQWGNQNTQIALNQPMNHWFGMTIETTFMQPADGKLYNGDPMTFEFSGDDDVWIFIDDVLVADIGGNHSRIYVKIDYNTGEITYTKNLKSNGLESTITDGSNGVFKTAYLDEMFSDAGKLGDTAWNGHTFANNTIHTLKFFYLERGNAASNCNISFNLQEPIVDHIRKVDQNGDPLAGAEFELYTAKAPDNIDDDDKWWTHTADEFTALDLVTTTVSNGSGYASLTEANGGPLDLTKSKSKYYILREKSAPEGYRQNPDIVLKYNDAARTLIVVNKYEVGAYASFLAEWASPTYVNFAKYDNKTFSKDRDITGPELENGLAVVVPVIKSEIGWDPMYGSNTLGWNTVSPKTDSEEDLINALAKAALRQIADTDPKTQHWYLYWDGAQLKGHMENLPGDATRYIFNKGSDGDLITLFLPKDALEDMISGTYTNADERYVALREELAGKDANYLDDLVTNLSGKFKIIYTDDPDFEKNNRTVIYVPNEQRELRVRKVNENGKPIQGAVFALFGSVDDAVDSTNMKAYGITDANGELIFCADSEVDHGYMNWDNGGSNSTAVYWLKEITAPTGYELNKNLIRVEVSDTAIYANATGVDPESGDDVDSDGISVEASLGGLTQTLVKYAEGIVDETLMYITATEQTANSTNTWSDGASMDLTYGADGYAPAAKFTADNGYIRVMPRQTTGITGNGAKRDDLTGIDLDGLFSLVNTVVVTDHHLPGSGYVPGSPSKPTEPDKPTEPNVSDDPSEPSDPSEPDRSDALNTSDNNPHTGFDASSIFRGTVLTLSLIAVVYPQRKRGKHKKQ